MWKCIQDYSQPSFALPGVEKLPLSFIIIGYVETHADSVSLTSAFLEGSINNGQLNTTACVHQRKTRQFIKKFAVQPNTSEVTLLAYMVLAE